MKDSLNTSRKPMNNNHTYGSRLKTQRNSVIFKQHSNETTKPKQLRKLDHVKLIDTRVI